MVLVFRTQRSAGRLPRFFTSTGSTGMGRGPTFGAGSTFAGRLDLRQGARPSGSFLLGWLDLRRRSLRRLIRRLSWATVSGVAPIAQGGSTRPAPPAHSTPESECQDGRGARPPACQRIFASRDSSSAGEASPFAHAREGIAPRPAATVGRAVRLTAVVSRAGAGKLGRNLLKQTALFARRRGPATAAMSRQGCRTPASGDFQEFRPGAEDFCGFSKSLALNSRLFAVVVFLPQRFAARLECPRAAV